METDGKVTYHQQVSYCGKPRCRKCREGVGHGPYWYAYRTVNGRTTRTYIGKELPATVREAKETIPTDLAHVSLRIYTLGQFRLERRNGENWQPVTDAAWQHQRTRSVLACLLSNRGRKLGREQVMDALWPELDIEEGADQLNRAVHSLRHLFEPALSRPATSQLLLTEREMLMLADQTRIWIDADIFDELLAQAHVSNDPGQTEHLLEQASTLYNGNFLQEERQADWSWTTARREILQRNWIGLLLELADLRIARRAFINAVDPLNRLMAVDSANEAAIQRLMTAFTHLDRRGEALRAYHRFATVLQQEYQIAPSVETHKLYEAILKGNAAVLHPPAPPGDSGQQQTSPQTLLSRPTLQIGRSHQSPLVGRDHELEILHQLLLTTEQTSQAQLSNRKQTFALPFDTPRHPQCALLLGEVGIGKTRLAEEMAREARRRGWLVAWSRVYPQESNIPYRLWTETLRNVLAQGLWQRQEISKHPVVYHPLRTLLSELHDLLPEVAFPTSLPSEQEQLRLWEAVQELLTLISASNPLLIVLDDLQWSDGNSGELLGYLARRLHGLPIILVGTCRDTELPSSHPLHSLLIDLQRERVIETQRLHPLSDAQIAALVSHLPETLVQHIQTQAAGNPFFAEELSFVSPSEAEAIPRTIHAVLNLRLGRLSSACQRLLGNAVVLGGSFEFRMLRLMETDSLEEDMVLDLLEEALKAGMLMEEGIGAHVTYHFWHPLLVSHLYDTLSAARRATLHRRAADVLRQLHRTQEAQWAATIANHLVAGDGEPQHIVHYAELAGDHAYALSAYPQAERYYRLAVTNMGNPPHDDLDERLHLAYLLERLGECTMIQGNFEETRHLYEQVLGIRSQQKTFATPVEAQYEAQLQALLWSEMGKTWRYMGDRVQARQCCDRGELILREAGVVGGPAWARLCFQQSSTCWQEGNYDEAYHTGQEALRLFEGALEQHQYTVEGITRVTRMRRTLAGDPVDLGRTHALLGPIAATVGQSEEALAHFNTALTIFEQEDRQREIAHVCCNLGNLHLMKAEHSSAQAFFRRALNLAERIGDVPLTAVTFSNLGLLATRSGELAEAEAWYRRGIELADLINDQAYMSSWRTEMSIALRNQGKLSEALESIKRALVIGRTIHSAPCIGVALLAQGNLRIVQSRAADEPSAAPGEAVNSHMVREMTHNRHVASAPFLLRARTTLQHALALEGLEAETRTEGRLVLAEVSLLLGELGTAQQQAMHALEEARQHELIWLLARSQRLMGSILATLGQQDQAHQHFEQALREFRRRDMRLEYACTLYRYGEALLRYGNTEEASYQQGLSHLHEARQTFLECGAKLDLQGVERLLAAHAQTTPVSRDSVPISKRAVFRVRN